MRCPPLVLSFTQAHLCDTPFCNVSRDNCAITQIDTREFFLARGDHPNSRKNVPRMLGQMKIFHVGSHQFRESLRELLREFWFSYCSSRGLPFREWNFVFSEWNFEFRELLREYPGTLRELREWPFRSESVFPEIGVVPRLLIFSQLHRTSVTQGLVAGIIVCNSGTFASGFL